MRRLLAEWEMPELSPQAEKLRDFASSVGFDLGTLFIDVGDTVELLCCFDYVSAGRVLIYSDPPYLHETRSSSVRYRHEYTVGDHCRLLHCFCSMPENVSVIVSGYPPSVYDNALPGWRGKEFQAMTRGGVRTEKFWMNY